MQYLETIFKWYRFLINKINRHGCQVLQNSWHYPFISSFRGTKLIWAQASMAVTDHRPYFCFILCPSHVVLSPFKLDNLTLMEINTIRAFLLDSLNCIYKLRSNLQPASSKGQFPDNWLTGLRSAKQTGIWEGLDNGLALWCMSTNQAPHHWKCFFFSQKLIHWIPVNDSVLLSIFKVLYFS